MDWIDIKKKLEDADLDFIEKELKIQLPGEYRNMIKTINGGALKGAYYPSKKYGNIAYTRNTNLSSDAKTNIISLAKSINGEKIRYFPFGNVGNGDYFCLDLKRDKIVLYLHEEEAFIEVCESYMDFMQGLIERK